MNKLLLPLFLSCGVTSSFAFGLSDFSVEVHGGGNLINDVNHCPEGWGKSLHLHPQYGGQINYSLTDKFGVGVDYTFANNNQWNYDNTVHNVSAFATANLSNILSPHRVGFFQNLSANVDLGGGLSSSKWSNVTNPDQPDGSSSAYPHLLAGINLEYYLTGNLAVGLNGHYRYYFGQASATGNHCFHPTLEGGQFMLFGGIGVRYRFAAPAAEETAAQQGSSFFEAYKKWSYSMHAGLNVMNGHNTKKGNPQAGIQLEHDFNPLFGLGGDYTWINNNQDNYDDNVHNFTIFTSYNLTNLFLPHRGPVLKKLNGDLQIGVGEDVASWKNVTDPKQDDDTRFGYPHFLGGLVVDYSVNDEVAVGLHGHYRYYFGEPVGDGGNSFHPTDEGGQGLFTFGVSLRYKVGGTSNIRNCTAW